MQFQFVKQFALISFAVVYVASLSSINAQRNPFSLTDTDKIKIANSILLTKKFDDTKNVYGYHEQEVYLLDKNLPANLSKLLTKAEKVKIIPLSEKDLNERAKYGFDFYMFDEFKTDRNSVTVKFSTNWVNPNVGESTTNGTIYKCQKRNRNWYCKANGFFMNRS